MIYPIDVHHRTVYIVINYNKMTNVLYKEYWHEEHSKPKIIPIFQSLQMTAYKGQVYSVK
jgi:hypothetical protein